MNLMELLMAALLFGASAGSSLQIWSLISGGVLQQEQRQGAADRLEADLAALEATIRLQSRRARDVAGTGGLPTCQVASAALQGWLVSRPLGAGVQRQLTVLPDGEGLLLELSLAGGPWRRQRLYHPAAQGLCQPAALQPAAALEPNHG